MITYKHKLKRITYKCNQTNQTTITYKPKTYFRKHLNDIWFICNRKIFHIRLYVIVVIVLSAIYM